MATIKIGDETLEVRTHPNAPVVVNFYKIKGRKKVYNKDTSRMIFTTDLHAQWHMNYQNKFSDLTGRHYYQGNTTDIRGNPPEPQTPPSPKLVQSSMF